MSTISHCHFLALPLEIRLQIYECILQFSPPAVTFAAAQLSGTPADLVHRLYGEDRSPFYGIPKDHIPLIEPRYDASLLSISQPALVDARSPIRSEELGQCQYSPRPALLRANRQIYHEIMKNMLPAQRRGLGKFSLFIAFPYGLRVFDAMGSHLLPGIETLQIAGVYSNNGFSAARAAKVDTEVDVIARDSAAQLESMISYVLGEAPRVAQLQLRIFYPGLDSYSMVWGDDLSPTVIALRCIWASDIDIEVSRSAAGTGVCLTARPSSEGRRNVSTYWTKLTDGRQWVVNPAWPTIDLDERADQVPAQTVLQMNRPR